MPRKKSRRNEWHKDTTGRWSRSMGERGLRLRLFEKRIGGPYYCATWVAGRGRRVSPLGTREREEAERLGRKVYAEMLLSKQDSVLVSNGLSLGELWRRYSQDCGDFRDNKHSTRKDSQARAQILLGYFGHDYVVSQLSSDRQREYERKRRAGGILTGLSQVTRPVRDRSVEADLVLLHTMLTWATTVRLPDGRYLLDRHPLQQVRRPNEKNKKRPVATHERYLATRKTIQDSAAATTSESERTRWIRLEFALFLAEATGRRLGSIRQLRWEDFCWDREVVFWRAEADKKGYEWKVPMPLKFFDDVRLFQRQLGAVGGHVFASSTARDGIMDRHWFDKWLHIAEENANLPKLDGGQWHPYRRKWAIERKHLPLKDVAAAGGWKSVDTLLEVYQQADEQSVLAVTSETRKLYERGVA